MVLLSSLQEAVARAQERLNLACSGITAGHNLGVVQVVAIGGADDAPTLIVRLPPAP